MAKKPNSTRKLRSAAWFNNPDNVDMTALYVERTMNFGISLEELQSGKPVIGIAQSGSDLSPCNRHHIYLAERVRDVPHPTVRSVEDPQAFGRISRRPTRLGANSAREAPQGHQGKRHHAKHRITDGDIFDNRLIFGDMMQYSFVKNTTFNGTPLPDMAVLDADGRYQASRSVLFDITSLHQTRQQSRALAAELGVMLDNELIGMVRMIVTLDPAGGGTRNITSPPLLLPTPVTV